jgi:hypothetical protein
MADTQTEKVIRLQDKVNFIHQTTNELKKTLSSVDEKLDKVLEERTALKNDIGWLKKTVYALCIAVFGAGSYQGYKAVTSTEVTQNPSHVVSQPVDISQVSHSNEAP